MQQATSEGEEQAPAAPVAARSAAATESVAEASDNGNGNGESNGDSNSLGFDGHDEAGVKVGKGKGKTATEQALRR